MVQVIDAEDAVRLKLISKIFSCNLKDQNQNNIHTRILVSIDTRKQFPSPDLMVMI